MHVTVKANLIYRSENAARKLKVVYTAVHGVGTEYVQAAVKMFNLSPVFEVPEQAEPNGDFPTVIFPNPEEPSTLELAIRLADREYIPLVIANDPDVDRFCMAEREESKTWKYFSGNDIGALFAWWLLEFYCKRIGIHRDKIYMLSSTVSSKILQSMAAIEGFHFEETLTGFKWLGARALQLQQQGNLALFCFEEAIGYRIGDGIYDKDGVTAAVVAYEMASYLYSIGKTVASQLQDIYTRYGLHLCHNSYYICYRLDVIMKIFANIRQMLTYHSFYDSSREMVKNVKFPISIGKYQVNRIRDLTSPGYDSAESLAGANHVPILPVSSSSKMITIFFTNGVELTLRTSGTEPKIKFYSSLILRDQESLTRCYRQFQQQSEKSFINMVNEIVLLLLDPEKNQLIERST